MNKMYISKNIKRLFTIYIYERKSSIRKTLDDWSIEISFSTLRKCLFVIGILIPTLIYFVSYYTRNYVVKEEIISFTVLMLIIHLLITSLGVYQRNKNLFLLDEAKVFHYYKEFRNLRIISKLLEESIKHTILYWFLLFIPFYLGQIVEYTLNIIIVVLLSSCIYFLSSIFFYMLFTYFMYVVSRVFQAMIISEVIGIFIFAITCLISFCIPYLFFSNLFKQERYLRDFFNILNGSFLEQINILKYFYIGDYDIYILLKIATVVFLLCILMTIIWVLNLKKIDLIAYKDYRVGSKLLRDKSLFFGKRSPFFVKDLIFLTRLNKWWWEHLGRTIIAFTFLVGIVLPVIRIFIQQSSPVYFVSIIIFCSIFLYQIVGDSFRMLLAIDHEIKNINLFMHRKFFLWELTKEKLKIYQYFIISVTFFILLISYFFIKFNFLNVLLVLSVSSSFGVLSSLIQISTTALYPKKNWEHIYEVGESHKASTYNDILNTVLIVGYTAIPVVFHIFDNYTNVSFKVVSTVIIFILCVVTFIGYLFSKLLLTKIELKEVLLSND